jgi:hypothetical protein
MRGSCLTRSAEPGVTLATSNGRSSSNIRTPWRERYQMHKRKLEKTQSIHKLTVLVLYTRSGITKEILAQITSSQSPWNIFPALSEPCSPRTIQSMREASSQHSFECVPASIPQTVELEHQFSVFRKPASRYSLLCLARNQQLHWSTNAALSQEHKTTHFLFTGI